jgi:DnaJ-class molecular chaperone
MAADDKDYYRILGVSEHADEKSIRQAFRKLARQYHPDVNPGDKLAEERFKEINEAYEVLSDPAKRQKYDEMRRYRQQYGHWPEEWTGAAAGRAGGFRGRDFAYRTINEEDLEDLFGGQSPFSSFFETFFHSGFSPGSERRSRAGVRERPATRGEDTEAEVEVSLADAYQGARRMVELTEPDGRTRRLEVTIPAGVDEGSRIRLAGYGAQGAAGRGDLYLRVHIRPDPRFTREGATLHTTVDVPLAVALLGGEASVELPDGRRLMLRIPPTTQNGRIFRLRGRGMPERIGQAEQRGDLYVEARVVLPTQLNDEQQRLLEAFARSLGYTNQGSPTTAEDYH